MMERWNGDALVLSSRSSLTSSLLRKTHFGSQITLHFHFDFSYAMAVRIILPLMDVVCICGQGGEQKKQLPNEIIPIKLHITFHFG
jgi:hypothetical protein